MAGDKPQNRGWANNSAVVSSRSSHWKRDRGIAGIGSVMNSLALLATGGMSLVALFLLVGIGRSGTQFFSNLVALFTSPQPQAQVDVRSMIVHKVQGVSELTTAVFAMETVVPASRERTIGGFEIGKTTLLYIAYGEVRAGVNLASLTAADVQVNGDSVVLRLPPPQILDSKIDVNRSKVYDYDRGFMGLGPDVAPELQELAQRTTLERLIQSACTGNLLQTANDRAKLAVSQLLDTAGYGQVAIEIQPPLPNACPAVPTSNAIPPEQTLQSDSPPAN